MNFLLAACRPQFSDFNPLKQGETLVNFFGGVFLVTCRSECAHFNPSEGGKRSSIFCWLLADRIVRFLTLKTRGNARRFFIWCFWSLSVPKSTFPTPNSIEFGAGSVDFEFVSLSALALRSFSAPGAVEVMFFPRVWLETQDSSQKGKPGKST